MSEQQKIIKDDEIDLSLLFRIIWQSKKLIILVGAFSAIVGIIYSLSLPNIFMSVAKLGPTESYQNSGSQLNSSGLGGLAALAGINISSTSSTITKVQIAIETANSKDFYKYHAKKRNLLPTLLFVEGFDSTTKEILYDDINYKASTNEWPNGQPSIDSGYEIFHTNFLISQDRRTGVISMSMKSYYPELSKIMLDNAIYDLNEYLKEKDSKEAEAAFSYLTNQIALAGSPDMKRGLVSLALQKSSILMLSEIAEQYALSYIDSADIPIKKASPRRSVIVMLFGVLGGILGILISVLLSTTNLKLSLENFKR